MSDLSSLSATILQMNLELRSYNKIDITSINFWPVFGSVLIFFMQAGFGLFEAGSVKEENIKDILPRNLMVTAIISLAFWIFGFGFAYGGGNSSGGGIIGVSNFGLWKAENEIPHPEHGYTSFFFQWASAVIATTIGIVSLAERGSNLIIYFIYSLILSSFIYPVVVHWVWDEDGIFYGLMLDFAGSGVLHMVGGFSALVAIGWGGPRPERFKKSKKEEEEVIIAAFPGRIVYDIPGHSPLLSFLGVMILWIGWYGLNCSRSMSLSNSAGLIGKIVINTTLAAATGALTVILINPQQQYFLKLGSQVFKSIPCLNCLSGLVSQHNEINLKTKLWDRSSSLNGVLAGLVSISAGCAFVDPWMSFLIGIISAVVYMGNSYLLKFFKIDDPLNIFAIHGACGVWGIVATGFFATKENVEYAGVKWIDSGTLIGYQILGALCIAAWTMGMTTILFFCIKCAKPMINKNTSQDFDGNVDVEMKTISEA